jgi:hypothetical protein
MAGGKLTARIAGLAPFAFAATMTGVGLVGLARPDWDGVWRPIPRGWPAHHWIALGCAALSVVTGLGMLWRRTKPPAAGVLALALAAWLLATRLPGALKAPLAAVGWESCGETAVILAAAWAVFAGAGPGGAPRLLRPIAGPTSLRLAQALYGLAMLAFGAAHFAYVKQTAALVPHWLPWHDAWVYATGAAYVAASAAIVADIRARLAASLSALQMGLFTLLVWVPAVLAKGAGADAWSEAVLSWTLTAGGWAVAQSCRAGGRGRRPRAVARGATIR